FVRHTSRSNGELVPPWLLESKPVVQIELDDGRMAVENTCGVQSAADVSAHGAKVIEHRIDHVLIWLDAELVNRQPTASIVRGAIDGESALHDTLEFELDRDGFSRLEFRSAIGKTDGQRDR